MRRIAFIVAVLGTFSLLLIMLNLPPKEITSPGQLNSLNPNQKVIVSGFVTKQTESQITLNSNLSLYCKNCPSFKGKNITILGLLSTYENKIQISVLNIKEMP